MKEVADAFLDLFIASVHFVHLVIKPAAIILFVIALALGIFRILLCLLNKKADQNAERVLSVSTMLRAQDNLNERFSPLFIPMEPTYHFVKICENKDIFKSLSVADVAMATIYDSPELFERRISSALKNQKTWQAYLDALSKILHTIESVTKPAGFSYESFRAIEDVLFYERKLDPVLEPQFSFSAGCVELKEIKEQTFSLSEIRSMLDEVTQHAQSFKYQNQDKGSE